MCNSKKKLKLEMTSVPGIREPRLICFWFVEYRFLSPGRIPDEFRLGIRLLLRLFGTGSSPNFDANRVCLSLSNLTLFRIDFCALSGGKEGFSFDISLVIVFRVSIGLTVCRAGTLFFGMVDLTSNGVTFLTLNF